MNDERIGRFNERLRDVIGTESIRQFAQRAEMSDGTLHNILRGGEPKLDSLIRIADAAGVSIEWLVTGNGPKRTKDSQQENYIEKADDFIFVSHYDVEASAGSGSEINQELVVSRMAFRRDWIEAEGLKPERLAIIRAKGDSMEPTISDGCILLVDVFNHKDGYNLKPGFKPGTLITREGVYVIRLNNHLVVKRLQLDMQGGLFIKSDNSAYDTIHLNKDSLNDILIVGRAVWEGKML